MSQEKIKIGIDRFLARRWADYALDLRLSAGHVGDPSGHLKSWLAGEIKGIETVRKTNDQLRRLWLANDSNTILREDAIQSGLAHNPAYRPLLHFGMAINVSPFYRDLCIAAGRLIQLQGYCQRKEVQQRLYEKYGNPSTIKRAAPRGLQTLEEWGFFKVSNGLLTLQIFEITDSTLACWLIKALLFSAPERKMTLSSLAQVPEKLGIQLSDERAVIRGASDLSLERNGQNEEVVACKYEV